MEAIESVECNWEDPRLLAAVKELKRAFANLDVQHTRLRRLSGLGDPPVREQTERWLNRDTNKMPCSPPAEQTVSI